MRKIQLIQALTWLQRPSGKTVVDNRADLVRLANRIRAEIYSIYDEVQWANEEEEMLQVQALCRGAEGSYHGIVLPDRLETIEQAFYNGTPIGVYSRHREGRDHAQLRGSMELREMNGTFPTQLDAFQCGEYFPLLFIADHISDKGKQITFGVETIQGEREIKAELPVDGWGTIDHIKSVGSVLLPTSLKGGVKLAQKLSTGSIREIARYGPKNPVPSFRRFRLIGGSPNCDEFIRVIGTTRFSEVWFDDDWVEIDNLRIWEEGANYFRYVDQGSDGELLQKAEYHRGRMMRLLVGDKSRKQGKSRRDQFAQSPVRRSRLRGARR